jgi:hypothetical protein
VPDFDDVLLSVNGCLVNLANAPGCDGDMIKLIKNLIDIFSKALFEKLFTFLDAVCFAVFSQVVEFVGQLLIEKITSL